MDLWFSIFTNFLEFFKKYIYIYFTIHFCLFLCHLNMYTFFKRNWIFSYDLTPKALSWHPIFNPSPSTASILVYVLSPKINKKCIISYILVLFYIYYSIIYFFIEIWNLSDIYSHLNKRLIKHICIQIYIYLYIFYNILKHFHIYLLFECLLNFIALSHLFAIKIVSYYYFLITSHIAT